MKLFLIAWSNIKKRKSSAITLVIMTLLATIMLTISLSLITGVGSLFDARVYELNASHIAFTIDYRGFDDDMLTNAEGLIEYQIQTGLIGEVRYDLDGRSIRSPFIFTVDYQSQNLNRIEVLDRLSVAPSNPIILPLSFRINGFSSGDVFNITSAGIPYTFIIYGFFESIFFGSPGGLAMGFVSQQTFDTFLEDSNLFPSKVISMQFETIDYAQDYFWNELLSVYLDTGILLSSYILSNIRLNATMFSFIMAALMSLIAVITVIIALIVARFNIINNIEQDIKTLGALKGIGFSNKQIINAIILQFLLIIAIGAIIGVIISIPLMGAVGNLTASTSGLLWAGLSMVVPSIISVIIILGIIILTTFLIARRTKKITPINALRSGLDTHNFKKSAVKLDTGKLPLNISMAIKQFKTGYKRNIAAFITLILFGFVMVLGFTMHYNFVVDTSAYRQMVGAEPAHVRIVAFDDDMAVNRFDEILDYENVRTTLNFGMFTLINSCGARLGFNVFEDIGRREVNTIIRGRHPLLYNEISIAADIGNLLGAGLGDTLSLTHPSGEIASFIISGIFQGWGSHGHMTIAGIERMQGQGEVVLRNMYIYLYDYSNEAIIQFMNVLIADFGRGIIVQNYSESFYDFLAAMQTPINIAMIFISTIIVAIIALVLFLMVNTIINRGKKEAGILKAMGFSSGQLILQMLLSFIPIILGGVILGVLIGVFTTNPLLGIMFSGIGIAEATFIIVPWLTVVGAVALILTSITTLLLISLKYKRICARELMAEG